MASRALELLKYQITSRAKEALSSMGEGGGHLQYNVSINTSESFVDKLQRYASDKTMHRVSVLSETATSAYPVVALVFFRFLVSTSTLTPPLSQGTLLLQYDG